MKTYDIVKMILLSDHKARNSDKHLMWEVWKYQGANLLVYSYWMDRAAHPKSIIEARRNLQREQEEALARGEGIDGADLVIADDTVRKFREKINLEKGTHIFREDVPVIINGEPIYTKHKNPKAKCPKCGELLKTDIKTEPGHRENSFIATKFLVCPNGDFTFEVKE